MTLFPHGSGRVSRLFRSTAYVLTNFSASIVFYLAFHEWGAKAAIGLAVFMTGLQLLFHWIKRRRPTIFFIITTVFIVLFGGVDLLLSTPKFFRLEPFAQNFLIASIFLGTYLARISIFSRLARDLPPKLRPQQALPEEYYRKVTRVWIVYLYVKAVVFLILALKVDLGSLILLRSILGGVTLLIMFLGELFYRKRYLAQQRAKAEKLDNERINA